MSTYLKYDKFVLNTRALLKSHNMLNKDLAAEINTTEATISRYLTGKREPEVEYIYRIATYFDVFHRLVNRRTN